MVSVCVTQTISPLTVLASLNSGMGPYSRAQLSFQGGEVSLPRAGASGQGPEHSKVLTMRRGRSGAARPLWPLFHLEPAALDTCFILSFKYPSQLSFGR